MKRRTVNNELRAVYAMIQLMQKSPDSIKFLHHIRINPKLILSSNQKIQMRADLEFYLPQILAHYLREDLDEDQEQQIGEFIILACK